MSHRRAAVIGLGLIGGSIAAALRETGVYVRGYDRSPAHARTALRRDLVDELDDDLPHTVAGADVVILAVPVLTIVALLPALDLASAPDALILDTGSVKEPIVTAMATLTEAGRAIGGHPLAGDERAGPDAAHPALLRDRPFVLSPSPRTTPETVARAQTLVSSIGAEAVLVPAERHDRILARTSHLPQLVATALAGALEPDDLRLAGPGLRDMTRLAHSDPTMWAEIAEANRDNIIDAMRTFGSVFAALSRMIEEGDFAGMRAAMEQGSRQAAALRVKESA